MDFFLMIKLKIHHDLIVSALCYVALGKFKTVQWAFLHEARLCKESGRCSTINSSTIVLKMFDDLDLVMVVEAD